MKLDKKLKKNIGKLVKLSFDDRGQINEKTVKASVEALKTLSRSKVIPSLTEYLIGLKREIKKTTLEISSTVSLSESHVAHVTKVMKQESPVNQVETNLDSSLLGGLRIKIGDLVYDDSVSQKIKQLKGAING